MKLAPSLALVAALHVAAPAAFAESKKEPESGSDAGLVLVLVVGALILLGGGAQPAVEPVGQ